MGQACPLAHGQLAVGNTSLAAGSQDWDPLAAWLLESQSEHGNLNAHGYYVVHGFYVLRLLRSTRLLRTRLLRTRLLRTHLKYDYDYGY